MPSMSSIEKYFEPVVIVSALAAVVVLVFANVIARFAFSTSIPWAGELARLSFVYMIYFGVAYAIRGRRHMRVTVLVDLARPQLRRILLITAELVFLVYSATVCWLGVVITQQAVERSKILSATQWPTAVLYAAIILSGGLSVLRLVQEIRRMLREPIVDLPPQMDV